METTEIGKQEGSRRQKFDLADRALDFARQTRLFIKGLPRTIANSEDAKQLVRSSGSIGANYIEANESLSRKDFILRLKIARKEAKETEFWLKLVDVGENAGLEHRRATLSDEANQLLRILTAILRKVE